MIIRECAFGHRRSKPERLGHPPNYAYNGDEMMKSETTGGVTVNDSYDGDGQRIEKSNGTIYWYGSGGQVLDETNLSGSLTNEYVFFGGKRIARRDSSNNIFYYFADDLGTSREIVQSGQTTPCYDADFYPYGGEILPDYANSCATSQNYKFTGKERDAESGLDDFGARYYASSFGRFVSADWAANATAVPYANFGNPQSLNLYTYVRNNPTTTTDPDGHQDETEPDPKVTEIENRDVEEKLTEAGRELSRERYAPQSELNSRFIENLKANGGDDPVTGMCYAPPRSENGKPGEVYVTDPQASGKSYVGRTTRGTETRMKTRTDGRTGNAETVATYKTTEEGRYKEQRAIDERGGKNNLDNKRNEVNPQKMQELKKKYGGQSQGG